MGKSTISTGPFSIATLNYQRLQISRQWLNATKCHLRTWLTSLSSRGTNAQHRSHRGNSRPTSRRISANLAVFACAWISQIIIRAAILPMRLRFLAVDHCFLPRHNIQCFPNQAAFFPNKSISIANISINSLANKSTSFANKAIVCANEKFSEIIDSTFFVANESILGMYKWGRTWL